MKKKKNFLRGWLATETRALIVGAGLLIAGVLVGVSGAVDGDVALLLAGSVLTVISIYTTTSAFMRYQWDSFVEDIREMYTMGKISTESYLAEIERRKKENEDR